MDRGDHRIDHSVSKIIILYLFPKDERGHQVGELAAVLFVFRTLSTEYLPSIDPLDVEFDSDMFIVRQGNTALLSLYPFVFQGRGEVGRVCRQEVLMDTVLSLLQSHDQGGHGVSETAMRQRELGR